MNQNSLSTAVILVASAFLLVSQSAIVQLRGEDRSRSPVEITDPIAERWLGEASRSLAAERAIEADGLADPAFDVYVSPSLIGQAYAASDAALLTDVALQLAEGERVLFRSRSGITAAQAFQLAVNAASQKQDKGSLQRLAKFAESRGDKLLGGQVAAAEKLAAVSRDTTYRMMIPIEEIEVDDYSRLRYCVQRIDQARLTGDTRGLEALDLDIEGCIPGPFQKQLRKMIGEAKAAIPAENKVDDQLVGTLSKLAAISRDEDEELEPADEPVQVSSAY